MTKRVREALLEIRRICAKAGEEGWRVEEIQNGAWVQMRFVAPPGRWSVEGEFLNNRKAALASACAAMRATGF